MHLILQRNNYTQCLWGNDTIRHDTSHGRGTASTAVWLWKPSPLHYVSIKSLYNTCMGFIIVLQLPCCNTYTYIAGGIVKDQAEADEDTNWKQRVAIGIGMFMTKC